MQWRYLFLAVVWCLWRARNMFIMEGKEESMREIIFSVKKLALDLENSFPATTIVATNKTGISWRKPEKGWWKLNTDGSFVASTNWAAAGGLLRDEHGKWVWDLVGTWPAYNDRGRQILSDSIGESQLRKFVQDAREEEKVRRMR
ncbi:hypothetical protein Salat_1063800 [Sesamum alatum]|uniref:RNase H type-1 domain-containing protein n=1 Tax=Sesamum alatum TaxID=300844 RepID=A0AAE1YMM6_9LAMI|nr:hypothetical protein Salat_1063800 [Sesamum alatum]